MGKLKQFFTKKRNVAICAAVLVLLAGAGIGGVYAYGAYTQRIEAQQEAERLEARLAAIDADIATAQAAVTALYSDDTLELLADELTGEQLTQATELLDAVASYASTDPDITGEQAEAYAALVDELENATAMHDVALLYNSLYQSADDTAEAQPLSAKPVALEDTAMYLAAPSDAVAKTVEQLAEALDTIQDAKPLFYSLYSGYLVGVETELEGMQAAIDLVEALFTEDGEVQENISVEQLEEAQGAIDGLKNPTLQADLLEKLQAAQEWYKAQQEEPAAPVTNSSGAKASTGTQANTGTTGGGSPDHSANNVVDTGNTAPAAEAPQVQAPAVDPPAPTPAPEPEPTPTVEEPYIVSGYIGNSGLLFDDNPSARIYGYEILGNFDYDYKGFLEILVVYSDGTVKWTVDFYY